MSLSYNKCMKQSSCSFFFNYLLHATNNVSIHHQVSYVVNIRLYLNVFTIKKIKHFVFTPCRVLLLIGNLNHKQSTNHKSATLWESPSKFTCFFGFVYWYRMKYFKRILKNSEALNSESYCLYVSIFFHCCRISFMQKQLSVWISILLGILVTSLLVSTIVLAILYGIELNKTKFQVIHGKLYQGRRVKWTILI